jgi:hypothetical protein
VNKSKAVPQSKPGPWWGPGWSWKAWSIVALLLLPTFGFAVWVLAEAGGQTKIDGAMLSLARQNADGELGAITAITGTEHTVYHSNLPLPAPTSHREDGRSTLVWFTTTSCKECEEQAFVHTAVSEIKSERDFAFMEKELGREPSAKRLGVSETPTFVWLDAEGRELGRFTKVTDKAGLEAEIARILASQ